MEDEFCYVCGAQYATVTHHLIFGNGRRKFSDKYGLTLRLCVNCHNAGERLINQIHENPAAESLSKMLGQAIWERDRIAEGMNMEDARKRFIKECGVNYL